MTFGGHRDLWDDIITFSDFEVTLVEILRRNIVILETIQATSSLGLRGKDY